MFHLLSTPSSSETDHITVAKLNTFWSSTFEVEDVLSVDVTQFHPPESVCFFYLVFWEPIITLETKLTMALAGCSGSCSANRWHTFSVLLPLFLAIKPKILLHTHTHAQQWINVQGARLLKYTTSTTSKLRLGLTLQLCSRLVSICEQISRDVRTSHKNPPQKIPNKHPKQFIKQLINKKKVKFLKP